MTKRQGRRLSRAEQAALQAGEEAVERATKEAKSKQPRFAKDAQQFFLSIFRWTQEAGADEPEYKTNSMKRDKWLRKFWPQEPHLAGVLNSVVAIDKNRAWSLTGGRNQVRRYTDILHNAENGVGWRRFFGLESLAYYTADIGAITETGRDGAGGPLRALWSVDPARCRLWGRDGDQLQYHPAIGEMQEWDAGDFFRVVSMQSTDEAMKGLGFCAVSRCIELAQLMVAVYMHDQEALGAKAPKGLLLLKGIDETQWTAAMEARTEALKGLEREYYGGVAVLASSGFDDIDAKLVGLSQLPAGFDLETFTNLLMYGYALCFGYDPSEFWPVQYGALGRGTETEVQHRKATGKGGLDFILSYQEQLQAELPDSLLFEFEQRDTEGELIQAEVAEAWSEVYAKLYEAGAMSGDRLLDREEARSLLAEQGVIPREWTAIEEPAEASDTEEARALSHARVQRAWELFPAQPIVRYDWPSGKATVLWEPGGRRQWQGARVARQQEDDSEVLWADEDGEVVITEGDAERAVEQARRRVPEMAQLIEAGEVEGE